MSVVGCQLVIGRWWLRVVERFFWVGVLLAGAGVFAEFGDESAGEAEAFFGRVEFGLGGEGSEVGVGGDLFDLLGWWGGVAIAGLGRGVGRGFGEV